MIAPKPLADLNEKVMLGNSNSMDMTGNDGIGTNKDRGLTPVDEGKTPLDRSLEGIEIANLKK